MARTYLILDDVLAALRNGKKVTADKEETFLIPPRVSDTGKRRNIKVDVSSEGRQLLFKALEKKDEALVEIQERKEAALKKLEEEFLKEEKKAWRELNKIANHVSPIKKKESKKVEEAKEPEHSNSENGSNEEDLSNSSTPQDYNQSLPQQDETHNVSSAFGLPRPNFGDRFNS